MLIDTIYDSMLRTNHHAESILAVFPARLIRHINKVDAFVPVPVAPHIEKPSRYELPRSSAGPGFSRRHAGGLEAELRHQAIVILESGYLCGRRECCHLE
jgi:hypothetical protein